MQVLWKILAFGVLGATISVLGVCSLQHDELWKSPRTYTEKDIDKDFKLLTFAEDQLQPVGLAFITPSTTDRSTSEFQFDRGKITKHFQKNPKANLFDLIQALETFVSVGSNYLQKYGRPFLLRDRSGKARYTSRVRSEALQAKVGVARAQIASFRRFVPAK